MIQMHWNRTSGLCVGVEMIITGVGTYFLHLPVGLPLPNKMQLGKSFVYHRTYVLTIIFNFLTSSHYCDSAANNHSRESQKLGYQKTNPSHLISPNVSSNVQKKIHQSFKPSESIPISST